MIQISDELKNKLSTSTSIKVKNKIIVGTTEFDGSVIKTNPKISHSNSTIFGGFPAKTCSFEMYNRNNNIDFENKELKIYKGIEVNDTTEWILQGIFIPKAKDIETNVTSKTVSFSNVQDKTQDFDVPYESNLSWDNNTTHTGLEIIQEICTKLSIELESNLFNLSAYNFKQPNFAENITYREVVSRFAEITGSIAFVNREGKLVIKSPTNVNYDIERSRYIKLTKENKIIFNTLVLGKEGMNDDIVYPEIIETDRVEYKIVDNPFVELYREEMIEDIAANIIGMSYVPFTLSNFVDGFCLDLNDIISVKDKEDNTLLLTLLNYEIANRISVNISAHMENTMTDYNLAGSSKSEINKVKLDVDHNKKKITILAEETTANTKKVSEIQEDVNGISASVSETTTKLTETDNKISDVNNKLNDYATVESVKTISNRVEENITATEKNTEIITKIEENGVTKLDTKTGFTMDADGFHVDKSGAPTSSIVDETGMEVVDKTTNETIQFSGYVDDAMSNKVSMLNDFLNQTVSYSKSLLFSQFLRSNNFRIEEIEDETHGKGLGIFYVGGD